MQVPSFSCRSLTCVCLSPCPHKALTCCFTSPCSILPKCQIAPGAGKISLSLPQILFSLLHPAFSPSFHPLWCFAIFASRCGVFFFPLKSCRLSAGINFLIYAVHSQMLAVAAGAPPCRARLTFPAQLSLPSINPQKEQGMLHMEIIASLLSTFLLHPARFPQAQSWKWSYWMLIREWLIINIGTSIGFFHTGPENSGSTWKWCLAEFKVIPSVSYHSKSLWNVLSIPVLYNHKLQDQGIYSCRVWGFFKVINHQLCKDGINIQHYILKYIYYIYDIYNICNILQYNI